MTKAQHETNELQEKILALIEGKDTIVTMTAISNCLLHCFYALGLRQEEAEACWQMIKSKYV